ncbi:hypothetical protein PoB_007034800 [Plakobranchus ocellatus]|uniref:Uncharacterized protein n=1 Tax=Plakobranchus ocellatus TaxID=259542 RepID=A0AAV4DHZ0_9GAST|nr:hypothetical protein PoB_007034800 [Plakobranchus ocellatus]
MSPPSRQPMPEGLRAFVDGKIASLQQGDLMLSGSPSDPRQKGPLQISGGLASHCATDALCLKERKVGVSEHIPRT